MSWECWQTESEQLFSSLWMESQHWAGKVMTLDPSFLLGSAAEGWEVMQCYQEVLCKGCANAFLSRERYFYLFLAHPWVQQDSLWEDTEGETTSWRAYAKGERHIPKQFILAAGFCCPFWFGGLVVWWFFFSPCFSFSSFDGNFSDSLTLQFIRRLGISWLPRSRESGVIHTGSWHGCCALWLWGSALQLGQPGVEPDVPGSEDLPLWKPEGPAAHAEAMVHFQRRLSGRETKHQARPQGCKGETPWELHRVLSCSYHPLWIPQGGGTEGMLRAGEEWQEKHFALEDGDGISHGGTQVQTLLPTEQGGIGVSKLRFNSLYPLSLSFILLNTTLVFLHPKAVPTAA